MTRPSASGKHLPLHVLLILATALFFHAPHLFSQLGDVNYDFYLHYNWAKEFAENLKAGDLYPRWMFHGHFGLGEPVFITYSPLYYYCVALFSALGLSTWVAMQWVAILGNAGFAGFIYAAARRFVTPNLALGMALAALLNPFLVMLHYKFHGLAWGAIAYLPHGMLLWAMLRPEARRPGLNGWAAVAIALAVGTHIISALVNLIAYSALCLVRPTRAMGEERTSWANAFGSWALTAGVGLLLSAIYLYPAIHFLKIMSPEAWLGDYRLSSFAWPLVTMKLHGVQWMSIQWPISVPALLMIVLSLIYCTRTRMGRLAPPMLLVLAAGLTAVFFASELSYPVWTFPNPISQINLPYRFVSVAYTLAIFATGLALYHASTHGHLNWGRLLGGAMALSLLFGVGALLKGSYGDGKPLDEALSRDTYTYEAARSRFAQPDYPERCAKNAGDCVRADRSAAGFSGVPEYVLKGATPQADAYAQRGFIAHCEERGARCEPPRRAGSGLDFRIHADQPLTLSLPLFHYPGWQVSDGQRSGRSSADPATGLIQVQLDAGTHDISVRWAATDTEKLGAFGSLAGLALLIILGGTARLRRRAAA